jgi:phosphatidylserine/phosphatidylglycerophosphate/cardiolipin synthase-like enzyme
MPESTGATDPSLLVTGRYLSGQGLRAIMPVMQELIASAQREIQILAYVITPSAAPLLHDIDHALARGIRTSIVVNVIPNEPVSMLSELNALAATFAHARIRYFHDREGSQLHAKVLIADRRSAVIGSANYSWGGLVANHEIGFLLGGQAAWDLGELADLMYNNSGDNP